MGSCCDKDDDSPNESFTPFVIGNRWKSTRFLGKGSYGRVYEVFDMKSSSAFPDHLAMKIEQVGESDDDPKTGRLPHELNIIAALRRDGRTRHFVDIFDFGALTLGDLNASLMKPSQYVVMTLLGPSLVDLAELCPKKSFSAPTMACIGKQVLNAIQAVHECGYLHRDIKPANLMVGMREMKHEIYVIDFGFARRFLDSNGSILPPRPKAPFRGTAPYVSYDAFNYHEQSPGDDLWAMFYTLIDLRTGNLPWGKIARSSVANELKRKTMPHDWLKKVEPEYLTFYEFLTSLHYDMFPDYDYLNCIYDGLMKRNNVTMETPLDWEPNGFYYKKLNQNKLRKMFDELPLI